jgi:hypothetical protein
MDWREDKGGGMNADKEKGDRHTFCQGDSASYYILYIII